MLTTTLIGFWAINRIEAKAALLFEQSGLSALVLEEFIKDFGAKTGLILGLLSLICALSAWALGRGIATPIEDLAHAAESVSSGADLSSLPHPSGRELRRLRSSLVRMHEALEDRRQFERFIADLSHDLKNPVAAIRASLEVLQSGAHEDPVARSLFLNRAEEASLRLNKLLSDFLGLAKLEARGLQFDPQPLRPLIPVQNAIQSLRGLAELKEIELILQAGAPEKKVTGSSRWLTRAFENLLSNAIKFSPNKGSVWIDWFETEDALILIISDEGSGVTERARQDLFNRFTSHASPQNSSSRTPPSSGLGLSIVKHTIEAHGGQVLLLDLSSEETKLLSDRVNFRDASGAQFVVSLPFCNA